MFDIVNEATDILRDEMEEAIRNLHLDMLRQFQEQSKEFRDLISEQMQAVDQLILENERLREENRVLRENDINNRNSRKRPNVIGFD
jgi:regulator of replication initiation timing